MTHPRSTHHRAIPYQPGLDGLRGVAVAAVLLFHHGVGWAEGGFLGVSAFFTLSGFLIASILTAEHERTGSISLRRFWVRRARRLLPAAWLCLAGIVVFGHTLATGSQASSLRGDVVSSVGYLANWRLLATGDSYEALFSAPSPINHLWSLAIEEQFYLLFPLVTIGVIALASRAGVSPAGAGRVTGIAYALLAAASTAWLFVVFEPGADTSRVYYGTDTRAAELLIGAAAGVAYHRWAARSVDRARSTGRAAAVQVLGVAALVGFVVMWASVGQTTAWLYQGGLSLHALAVVAVIVAAHSPGPVRRLLAVEPLRQLGLISYGVYLYHWPVFLALDPVRTGLDGWALFAVRAAASLAAATLSYHLLEMPFRNRERLLGRYSLLAAPSALAVLLVPVLLVAPQPSRQSASALPAPPRVDELPSPPAEDSPPMPSPVSSPGGRSTNTPASAAPEPAPPRVTVFGDSTALVLASGLAERAESDGDIVYVGGRQDMGCGLTRHGEVDYQGSRGPVAEHCNHWDETWPAMNRAQEADVAVILVGPWDVTDRKLPGDDRWRAPGDRVYDDYLRAEIRTALDVLTDSAATVVWLTSPRIELGRAEVPPPSEPYPASDPARMERFNDILAAEVAATDGAVHLVDFAGYMADQPGGELDPALRPDGVHLTEESSRRVAGWLVPRLIDIHEGAGALG